MSLAIVAKIMTHLSTRIERRTAPSKVQFSADLHPLLQRIYAHRGVQSEAELALSLQALLPISSLGQVDAAAALLQQALAAQWRIVIIGDFDADGATSTALAVSVLRSLGADVDFLVPNRFAFGYGLSPEIVAVAAEMQPQLLVTVDNGIANHAGVAAAQAAGMRVLITDHHLPAESLPSADVIVNPNSGLDNFASKALAGVGVIFYVMAALIKALQDADWFTAHNRAVPQITDWLDLVALGTVADLVELDQNNRILVEQGLRRIRAGKTRPGIEALCAVAGRDPAQLVSADLGFFLGPRINAAGRLDDMALGIQCLLATDASAALEMAMQLDSLNKQRRGIEDAMRQQAEAMLAQLTFASVDELPSALVLYREDWHQGVVGILASRVKAHWHRPVIAFADNGDGRLKGSARSITGVHMRDVLDAVNKTAPGVIERFGGHAMAAGLTIDAAAYDTFVTHFTTEVDRWVDAASLQGVQFSDGVIEPQDCVLATAVLLKYAAPWGQRFPEPCFDDDFVIVSQRVVGVTHMKMRVAPVRDRARQFDAIAFGLADALAGLEGMQVRLLYSLDVNRYNGRDAVQLLVRHFEASRLS